MTLHYTTRHATATTLHQLHYTTTTTPLQLHYNYTNSCTTPHYIQQLWVRWPTRWPLQPLQPLQKTQLPPPFGPSVDSLCHPWFTATNLSYRFPIFETSAAALCGTTGRLCGTIEVASVMLSNDIRWCSHLVLQHQHRPLSSNASPIGNLTKYIKHTSGTLHVWWLRGGLGLISTALVLLKNCLLGTGDRLWEAPLSWISGTAPSRRQISQQKTLCRVSWVVQMSDSYFSGEKNMKKELRGSQRSNFWVFHGFH